MKNSPPTGRTVNEKENYQYRKQQRAAFLIKFRSPAFLDLFESCQFFVDWINDFFRLVKYLSILLFQLWIKAIKSEIKGNTPNSGSKRHYQMAENV